MNAPALFRTKAQERAVISLVEGIRDGQALLALTGPDGVGKTVVLDAAVELLARQGVRVRRLQGPEGEIFGLPHLIGELLGKSARAVEDDDIEQLFETLTAVDCQSRLVLVFDDAQALGTDVLRYMQMAFSLKGLGISHHQVVFAGPPEFWEKLASNGCGTLGEQIGVRCTLEPLSEEEAGEYLNARLLLMDGVAADILTRPALTAIVQRGGGRPGRINAILENMLTGGARGRPHLLTSSAVNMAAAAVRDGAGAEPFAIPPAPALGRLPSSIRLASAPSMRDPAASGEGPVAMRQAGEAIVVAPRPRIVGPGLRHVPWRRGAVVLTLTLLVPGAAGVWHSARLAQPFAPLGLAASPAAAPIVVAADEQATDTQTADTQATGTQTGTKAEEGTPVPTKPGATGAGSTDDQAVGPGTASEAAMPPPTAEGKPASPTADAAGQPALPAGTKPGSPAETAGAGTPRDNTAPAAAGAEPASPSAPAAAPAATAGATHAPGEPAANVNPPARSEPEQPPAPAIGKAADASNPETAPPTSATPQAAETAGAPNPETSPPPPAAAQAAPAAPPPVEAATPPPAPIPANPVPQTAVTKPPDVPARSPAPAQPAARMVPARTSLSADTIAELLKRGDAMLAVGDISGARLFYIRAAEGGSAQAAMRVGKTYDPAFLSNAGVRGMPTDSAAAASWYRKAAALGDPAAAGELKRLSGGP